MCAYTGSQAQEYASALNTRDLETLRLSHSLLLGINCFSPGQKRAYFPCWASYLLVLQVGGIKDGASVVRFLFILEMPPLLVLIRIFYLYQAVRYYLPYLHHLHALHWLAA